MVIQAIEETKQRRVPETQQPFYKILLFGSLRLSLSAFDTFGPLAPINDTKFCWPRLDNAIHPISRYPADRIVCFANTYPLDSDLSGG